MTNLSGLNVVYFESRLAKTMGELIALQGGTPISAPAMREIPLEDNPKAFEFAEKLFKNEIDVLILLTGVGTRYLVQILETRYKREQIIEALKKTTVVPRGPKPVKALGELGVPFAVKVPEPNTWHEILSTLDEHQEKIPLRGRCVAVQEYGVPNAELLEGLKTRGAKPMVVPIYRWALPQDLTPLKSALQKMVDGKAQIAVFTTAVQMEHVFQVAQTMGIWEALKESFKKMVVASVGPDCTEVLKSKGITVDIQPESPKMGPLVIEVAKRASVILRDAKRHEGSQYDG